MPETWNCWLSTIRLTIATTTTTNKTIRLMLGDGDDDVDFAALEARLRGGGEMFHRVGAVVGFVCREGG